MSKQEVILCESLETSLGRAIELCPHDKLFVLTDEHTQRLCLPSLKESGLLKDAVEICIGAEDVHKTLETLASVWMALSTQGATRHSLLINLGGGMVTDLGGFAAATFKRGISYINIPTTLLAMAAQVLVKQLLSWSSSIISLPLMVVIPYLQALVNVHVKATTCGAK